MDLQFTKVGETYIAEYTATTHFNLHIEGGGRVALYRRTSGEGRPHTFEPFIISVIEEFVGPEILILYKKL